MIETLSNIFSASMHALVDALTGLFWPALFFLLLGLLVKRRALLRDIQRAIGETHLNIKIMIFNVLIVVPMIGLAHQIIYQIINAGGLALIDRNSWASVPTLLSIFVAIVIGDFVGYWRHRLEHTKLFWPSHAVHHSDTEMTWLTLERFHPFNRLTTFAIDNSVLLLLGIPPVGLIANNLVRHYYGYFIHADLPWTYGRLGIIFVSPAMHRWHHAADARFFNTNFATVFSLFDHIFGTHRVPGPCTSPLGVTDAMEASLMGQMIYALSPRAYRGLLSPKRRISSTSK